jgi:hypothetical protein
MASMWLNGFRPQTQIGGLQGFVNALFDGETPNMAEDRALRAAQMRAQTQHYDAGTGKLNSERALLDDRLGALQDEEGAAALQANATAEQVRAVADFIAGRGDPRLLRPEWTTEVPPDLAVRGAGDMDEETGAIRAPEIQSRPPARKFTPEGEMAVRRIAEAISTQRKVRQTQPNNPEQIGTTYARGIERLTTEDILAGILPADVGARRVAATDGKPLVNMNAAGQVIDNFSGAAGPSNPLVESSIGENRAQEKKYNTDAAADEFIDMMVGGRKVQVSRKDASRYAAEAAFRERQRAGGGAKEDKMISVTLPNGQVIQVREADYSREVVKQLFPEGEKQVKLNTGDIRTIQSTVGAYLDALEQRQSGKLPVEFRARVAARALELAGTPDYAKNGPAAVQAAFEEMAPDGFDETGNWFTNMFQDKNLIPRGGGTPAPRATQPATPRTPAAPATDMSGKPGAGRAENLPRPKSKAEFDALPMGSRFYDPQGAVRVKGGT